MTAGHRVGDEFSLQELDVRMQLSVSGKHLDIGDSLRRHVTTAIAASAERYFGRAIDGKVVFQRDGYAYRSDISLHVARGIEVQAHGEAGDPYAAFNAAAEHLDKRLRRHKRWLVSRRRNGQGAEDEASVEPTPRPAPKAKPAAAKGR